jgi:hypothetical protein
MARFWVFIDNKVQGPVEIPALRKLSGFNLLTQVCAEGQESWRVADEVIEIKAYFSAPPRATSSETDSPADFSLNRSAIEVLPPAADDSIHPMNFAARAGVNGMTPDVETLEMPADRGPVVGNTVPQPAQAEGLRQSCATCGYKNPRDVVICMKCGGALKPTGADERPKISLNALADAPAKATANPAASVSIAPQPAMIKAEPPTVEIPIKRIAVILVSVIVVGGLVFGGRQFFRGKKSAKHRRTVVVQQAASPNTHGKTGTTKSRKTSTGHSRAAALPGVMTPAKSAPAAATETEAPVVRFKPQIERRSEPKEVEATDAASYTVLDTARPLKHRNEAPVDSTYAVKRRGDRGLWSSKQEEAIQQVQNQRIYGGLRTIRRNAEILMQILRDREYSTAFENGKRVYLFNDADWSAAHKENTVYEVKLTFSGGKEADGSPRAPLRFVFSADLERRTVEPGGTGMTKANTLHAFFDESRIPPEERRSIAKDTEELVKAAQPGASPLALDTASKNYAATYSVPALTRVADAYGLSLVNKKITNQTPSVAEILEKPSTKAKDKDKEVTGEKPTQKVTPMSMSGTIEYKIEKKPGREYLLVAQAPTQATAGKVWETMTAYDRLTQFVPDMLTSRREGQDGAAIIVHTVSLTRLMFFVFKVNLHLRILEYPKQNRLEFERIAGDFERFSGYVEVVQDPSRTKNLLNINLSLKPKGYCPDWALRGMAKQFVVPVLDAIRAKAESN